jgi:hypothetical protein
VSWKIRALASPPSNYRKKLTRLSHRSSQVRDNRQSVCSLARAFRPAAYAGSLDGLPSSVPPAVTPVPTSLDHLVLGCPLLRAHPRRHRDHLRGPAPRRRNSPRLGHPQPHPPPESDDLPRTHRARPGPQPEHQAPDLWAGNPDLPPPSDLGGQGHPPRPRRRQGPDPRDPARPPHPRHAAAARRNHPQLGVNRPPPSHRAVALCPSSSTGEPARTRQGRSPPPSPSRTSMPSIRIPRVSGPSSGRSDLISASILAPGPAWWPPSGRPEA